MCLFRVSDENVILFLGFNSQLAELFIQAVENAICVCLDVNQGGRNCNRCTQRLVILHAQTY